MSDVLIMPTFRTKIKEPADNDGAMYVKKLVHPKVISLPSELKFYLKKFKHIYIIEQSRSSRRWTLRYRDDRPGWGDSGQYVKTLCSAMPWRPEENFFEALALAERFRPNEHAFYYENGYDYETNDPEFDAWFDKVMKNPKGLKDGSIPKDPWESK